MATLRARWESSSLLWKVFAANAVVFVVAVATLAHETCQLHPKLNSDLLLTAALTHDLGRTREFTYGGELGLTEEGRLLGHLVIGERIISERTDDRDLRLPG